jgi:hypothetical protein
MKTKQENDYVLELQKCADKMFAALEQAREIILRDLGTEIHCIESSMQDYKELHL